MKWLFKLALHYDCDIAISMKQRVIFVTNPVGTNLNYFTKIGSNESLELVGLRWFSRSYSLSGLPR